jgi:sigma-B regulation protein RsbU (phosphoserine phosphatase)
VFTPTTIRLAPGDTLLLFTDGLTEARAPTTEPSGRYGDEALRAFVRDLAPSTAGTAVTAIIALLDSLGDGRQDDAAVLALGVPDNPLPSSA